MKKENLNISDELIIKYLSNSANEFECKIVIDWILQNNENKQYFEKLKLIWNKSNQVADFEKFDVEKSLSKINSQIKVSQNIKIQKFVPYIAIAASVIILIGMFFMFKTKKIESKIEIKTMVLETTKNEIKEITLPDGSIVYMNENSKITYSEDFAVLQRNIKFEGEAYFQIAHNKNIPFYIYTLNATTKVVGTEFNLRAIKTENHESIIVNHGNVIFSQNNISSNSVELTIGETATINLKTNKIDKQINNDENYLAWKTGILIFTNKQLSYVAEVLSKYYKVDFEIQTPNLKDFKLTAKYDNLSLDKIIEIMKLTLNINIKKIDNKYIIS